MSVRRSLGRGAFTLVELLVVIGIIAVLIGLMLPSLAKARQQSKTVTCQSQLRQVGAALLIYANDNRGWIFPPLRHGGLPPEQRWANFVFKPAEANPKVLTCPADLEPKENHTYILNDNLYTRRPPVRYTTKVKGTPSSEIIVMGEKYASEGDYYMNDDATVHDYSRVVDLYKHGLRLGSNYLFLDLHAGTLSKKAAEAGITLPDPWDIPAPK